MREGGVARGGAREGGTREGQGLQGGPQGKRAGRTQPRGGPAGGPGGGGDLPAPKSGTVYVLRDGRPVRVQVVTGLTDGTAVEVLSGELKSGDEVVTGLEVASRSGQAMAPPPGMGGPMMGGGRR
jgi:HlyD family secretion protein